MKNIEKKIKHLGLGPTRRRHCSRRARVGPVQELADLKSSSIVLKIFMDLNIFTKIQNKLHYEICKKVFSVLGTSGSQPFFSCFGTFSKVVNHVFLFLFLFIFSPVYFFVFFDFSFIF